ncbi:MAG: hypothetical protein K9K66_10940 [Desulfarculaceae bacterium]|nr:hypothetical protein [Desulfarculaceae bacterium]MCF8118292.1 hypothetical protein [Desulfarculaceae bacterium]
MFAIGDFHIKAYATMLNEVESLLSIKVYQFRIPNVVKLIRPMQETMEARDELDKIMTEIKAKAKKNDIVFLASLRMIRLCDQWAKFDEKNLFEKQNSEEQKEQRRIALRQANELIDRLEKLGLIVLIEAPKPIFRSPPFRCSDWFNRSNPICASGFSMDREFLLKMRKPVMESIKKIKAEHKNVYVWDPFFILCPSDACSAYDGDLPLFFDGDHLNAHGNRILRTSFIDELLEIWSGQRPSG